MILVCGEALTDFVPSVANGELAYVPRTGGSPYNVALGLGRLGVSVGFLGRVSRDPFGEALRDGLVSEGVDCSLLRQGDEPTAIAIVHLPAGQEPAFVFYGDGAADCTLTADDLPTSEELGSATTTLHFGSISLVREPGATVYEQLMRREAGRRVLSLDPNVRPGLIRDRAAYRRRFESWVTLVDILKVSRVDLAWLYPDRSPLDAARALFAAGPSLVVVTRGAAGAVGITATGTVEVPVAPVDVCDTVGAGDAFTAGLLGFLELRGVLDRRALRSLDEEHLGGCLGQANRVASITCTRSGAQPPTRAEVLQGP